MKKLVYMLSFFILISLVAVGGVFASWTYTENYIDEIDNNFGVNINEFEYKPFEGVYIDSAVVYDYRNTVELATEFSLPTDLYSSVRASSGGSVTYKVTFHNNSSVNYYFIKQSYENDLANNSLVGVQNGISIMTKDHPGDTSSTFNSSDWIPANTYRDVFITYSFGSSAVGEITSFITYLFGTKMDSVYTNFVDVLNNADSYALLSQAFNEKYAETGEVVLANVGSEKAIFNQVFGGDITLSIDGKNVPVTIMIRRENVDGKNTGDTYAGSGPAGCEYTLYITIDELDPDKNSTGKATVFAVSYSEGGVSNQNQWYQLGELYEGTAQLDDYNGSDLFDYAKWQASAKEYVVADGITYKIGLDQGDQYQKMKKLEEIMAVRDNEIFNKINNTQILKKVYAIVYNNKNEGKPGYDILKQAFEDAAPFYKINNNGGDIPVNTNCTRAEILPYIEAIQKALDYYNQVN